MTATTPAPAIPVAVTANWRTRLLVLAEDVEWSLNHAAIARRLRALTDEMDDVEHRAIREAGR